MIAPKTVVEWLEAAATLSPATIPAVVKLARITLPFLNPAISNDMAALTTLATAVCGFGSYQICRDMRAPASRPVTVLVTGLATAFLCTVVLLALAANVLPPQWSFAAYLLSRSAYLLLFVGVSAAFGAGLSCRTR